ncbi:hypothetical protein GCM10023091_43060 [Ravibacter arvi]|uniref:Uncharacterized protein n=1 Tax=Ravibacter arvi TaxID=2051041 RepID=A0ABP8MDR6_9BACT
MIDLIKSILEATRDRLKSPVLGTYSLAFIIYNWRPILYILFSSSSIERKIDFINTHYGSYGAILWPLLITATIVVLLPFLTLGIELILIKPQFERKRIKHNDKVSNLDDRIEIAKKEFEIENTKSGTKTIESLRETIKSLEAEKNSFESLLTTERQKFAEDLQKQTDILQNEIDKNKETLNKISFSSKSIDTYSDLINSENHKTFYSDFNSKGLVSDESLYYFYENFDLAYQTHSGTYIYTELANEVYILNFEINNSNIIKKEFISLILELNDYESNSINRIEKNIDNNQLNIDKFRKPIFNKLLEMGYLRHSNYSNNYHLTEKGIELKKLIPLVKSGIYSRIVPSMHQQLN